MKSLKRFKAWPLIIVITGIYWIKNSMGINSISELNARANALLTPLIVALLIVGIVFVIQKLRSPFKKRTPPKASKN